MELNYLIFLAIPLILMIFIVIGLITLITPDEHQPKKSMDNIVKKVKAGGFAFTVFIFISATILIFLFGLLISPLKEGFLEGVLTETVGMLLDILIVLVFVTYVNEKAEKRKRIQRYKEEMGDFKYWDEKEAVFRVTGIIRRLQKEGVTEIELNDYHLKGAIIDSITLQNSYCMSINLHSAHIEDSRFINCKFMESSLKNIHISRSDFSKSSMIYCDLEASNLVFSTFVDVDFSDCKLNNSNLSETNFSGSEFINSNLNKSHFVNANLKGANFSAASLIDTNFTGANLENVDFYGALFQNNILEKTKLLGAKVNSLDFFEKLRDSNTKGIDIIENAYIINPHPIAYNPPLVDDWMPSFSDKSRSHYFIIEKNPDYPNFDDWYHKQTEEEDLPF